MSFESKIPNHVADILKTIFPETASQALPSLAEASVGPMTPEEASMWRSAFAVAMVLGQTGEISLPDDDGQTLVKLSLVAASGTVAQARILTTHNPTEADFADVREAMKARNE